MMRFPAAAAIAALLCFALSGYPAVNGHNITHILNSHKEIGDTIFGTFNTYLTKTRLAAEINLRRTITVCVVSDSGMSDLVSKNLTIGTLRNVLRMHVFLDYFDDKKLHQITNGTAVTTTMFQESGSADGVSGQVNITDLKGGKVTFQPMGSSGKPATFVKSVYKNPYNISVIQISNVLTSLDAEAPAPAPTELNLTALLESEGCGLFAHALLASVDAAKTFEDNINRELTVFCPSDEAMKKFQPEFKNLTGEDKQSLLEYHGVPDHYSRSDLRSNNGDMKTLASSGKDFTFKVKNDGDDVKLVTGVVTAEIKDSKDIDLLAIHKIDKVLEPKELFKADVSPTPAPAPAPEADAAPPKSGRKKNKKKAPAPAAADAPSPADSPSDSPADAPDSDDDQVADDNGAAEFNGGRSVAVILSLCVAAILT